MSALAKQSLEDLSTHLKGLSVLGDKERPGRVKNAQADLRYAVQTYFAHHVTKEETSDFRNSYYKQSTCIFEKQRKLSYEAYRGAAKTTLVTRLTTLWKTAIKREKRNAIIISSTLDVSKETLEFIKMELDENERLISDFDIRKGDKWTDEEIIFYTGDTKIRIKVFGAGKKIRGSNWLGIRPDWIVVDDSENDENVESKNQREKLYKWFIKAIMKLPSRQSTTYNIVVVGTKLHHDGLLSRLQNRADFANFRFPLVLAFPSNLDDLDKFNITAKDIRGMKLDDESLDKIVLIQEYLEDRDSFMSEFQNEPLSKEGTTFSDYITYESLPAIQSYTLGIDPALGKAKGDYFAITILAHDGKRFYATTKMYKIKATKMIDKIIEIYIALLAEGKPIKIAIETVQFQEFFKDVLDEKSKAMGLHLPIVELRNTVNKELRIDGISPLVNNASILINPKSLLLIDELDTYPKSAHDDGLDSLEMAYRIAKKPNFDYKKASDHLKKREERKNTLKRLLDA